MIATAFALIMLIITAYFLVGVVLTTAQVVSIAQTDQINKQEERVRTSIDILNTSISSSSERGHGEYRILKSIFPTRKRLHRECPRFVCLRAAAHTQ